MYGLEGGVVEEKINPLSDKLQKNINFAVEKRLNKACKSKITGNFN